MEESFEECNKNYKGKRSVNYQISEIKENRKVLTVKFIKYSDKIVNIDKFWVLWYERQRPRGRNTKSSILTVINKASGNYFNNNCIKNKVNKSRKENLAKIRVKNINLAAADYIGAHSKRRPKTKESIKNNPNLIRIFQAYPAYIRGLGLISSKRRPNKGICQIIPT